MESSDPSEPNRVQSSESSEPDHGQLDDALEPDYGQLLTNYWTQVIAFIPFCIVFLTFLIILCIRKLNDYYLQKSLIFIFLAMFIRIAQILIFYVLWDDKNDNSDSWKIL